MKPSRPAAAETRYAVIAQAFTRRRDVTQGAGAKKGFGASALSVRGKIFALLSSRGRFVVKLPKARVDELVVARVGQRFDPGHGRLMKEWLEVADGREGDWLALAEEAQSFVASQA